MVRQSSSAQRREDYEEAETRRNPYLAEYEGPRRGQEADGRSRRPIAYGSRMAGSRREFLYNEEAAESRRFVPDSRASRDRHIFEHRMPEEEEPQSRPGRMGGSAERAQRLEVTTDLFDVCRNQESASRAKVVQVPVPDGKRPRTGLSGERAGERQRPAGRRSQAPEKTVYRLEARQEGNYELVPVKKSAEAEPPRTSRQSAPASRPGMPHRRGRALQPEADMQRSAAPQHSPALRRVPASRPEADMQHSAVSHHSPALRRVPAPQPEADMRHSAAPRRSQPPRYRAAQQRNTAQSRRQRVLRQRLLLGAWVLCILLFAGFFALKNHLANVAEGNALPVSGEAEADGQARSTGTLVQGIPADEFAKHPEWTEDFLTPNEYSRPGEPLESVKNVFVHYTANPGTSAAQNRSYFEWQKDTHEASVSAHFIIGYEGEIIQCVPLDEIAYAVMTRNYDSVSIECCYLEEDGAFTQETYDSLISLLAWLTDIYDLDSEDILRHYDCGGKKCPLYYTEHEDAWEQLKKDVDKL